MSYILDALKKADAERERDAAVVPDLHAQGDAAGGARRSARVSGWALLLIALGALAVAALLWRWLGATPATETPPAALVDAPAPLPAPVAMPAQRPVTPQTALPLPTPSATVTRVTPPPPPLPRAAAPLPAPLAAATPLTPPKGNLPASATVATRLPTLAELPAELRGQLPALAVGGSVYSPNAASRIVILNGQVFREGDRPVDGLSIEQIGLKSTVLAYRGQRFELRH